MRCNVLTCTCLVWDIREARHRIAIRRREEVAGGSGPGHVRKLTLNLPGRRLAFTVLGFQQGSEVGSKNPAGDHLFPSGPASVSVSGGTWVLPVNPTIQRQLEKDCQCTVTKNRGSFFSQRPGRWLSRRSFISPVQLNFELKALTSLICPIFPTSIVQNSAGFPISLQLTPTSSRGQAREGTLPSTPSVLPLVLDPVLVYETDSFGFRLPTTAHWLSSLRTLSEDARGNDGRRLARTKVAWYQQVFVGIFHASRVCVWMNRGDRDSHQPPLSIPGRIILFAGILK